MQKFEHSVVLDTEKCVGCTVCVRRCPTEAIRVRNGKAYIIPERCVDCGVCIRFCPNHAKKAFVSTLNEIEKYKYKIVLPSPSIYGQFADSKSAERMDNALLTLGFDEVFPVAADGRVSAVTTALLEREKDGELMISSSCPAILRLIRARFPNLCDRVIPILSAVEIAAIRARKAVETRGQYTGDEIGIFLISPCAALATAVRQPVGLDESGIDGVISMSEVIPLLTPALKNVEGDASSLHSGINWAVIGGESDSLQDYNCVAADGIGNIMNLLEALDNGRVTDADFVELAACPGGCVGGILNVENPHVAKARICRISRSIPPKTTGLSSDEIFERYRWQQPLQFEPKIMGLSDNIETAMSLFSEIDSLTKRLPGINCGSCGAPNCRGLAEDIALGKTDISACTML